MATTGDIVNNALGGSSAASGAGASIVQGIIILATVLFFLIIVGACLMAFIWYSSYKHQVIVFEKTAEGKRIRKDRAKKIVRDGVTKYKLLWARATVQPPPGFDSKYFAGKSEALLLHKENDAFFFHIGYDVDEQQLKVLPQEAIDFLVNEIKSNLVNYDQISFWEKYGTVVVNIAFVVVVFVFMIKLGGDMQKVANGLASTAATLTNAVQLACQGGLAPP